MNRDLHLRLQAHFDGELSAGEAREFTDLIAKDTEAQALLGELQNTRRALVGFAADFKVPESREFYWSKIQRAIAQGEPRTPTPSPVSLFSGWRRFLVPASALAALAIAAIIAGTSVTTPRNPEVESSLTDAGAFTYRDYAKGTTLVWLSYPSDNERANGNSTDILNLP